MIKPNHFTFKIGQNAPKKVNPDSIQNVMNEVVQNLTPNQEGQKTQKKVDPKSKQEDLKVNVAEDTSNKATTTTTTTTTTTSNNTTEKPEPETPAMTITIEQDQIYSVEVTYLSRENMYYIIDDELLRSLDDPFKVSLDLLGKTETSVMLHQKMLYNYGNEYNGKSNNINNMGQRLLCLAEHLQHNCTNKCLPMKYRALGALSHFNDFTFPCKNFKEQKCMLDAMDKTLTSEKCEKSCTVKSYGGTHRSIKKDPSKNITTVGVLRTIVNERTEDVKEENRVYDMFGFVGTVGGTLSLFLGFSFYSIIEFWVHYLRELPEAF